MARIGRGQHAADHGGADRHPAVGAGAGCERKRQHAENEGEAGHQDRPQADSGGLDCRVDDARAFTLGALGKLDHQDRVLGRQSHGRDQPDLQVNVVLQPAQRDARIEPTRPIGMTSRTATGIDQLS